MISSTARTRLIQTNLTNIREGFCAERILLGSSHLNVGDKIFQISRNDLYRKCRVAGNIVRAKFFSKVGVGSVHPHNGRVAKPFILDHSDDEAIRVEISAKEMLVPRIVEAMASFRNVIPRIDIKIIHGGLKLGNFIGDIASISRCGAAKENAAAILLVSVRSVAA